MNHTFIVLPCYGIPLIFMYVVLFSFSSITEKVNLNKKIMAMGFLRNSYTSHRNCQTTEHKPLTVFTRSSTFVLFLAVFWIFSTVFPVCHTFTIPNNNKKQKKVYLGFCCIYIYQPQRRCIVGHLFLASICIRLSSFVGIQLAPRLLCKARFWKALE